PALPPWLDEGIADDLASARLDESSRLEVGALAAERFDLGDRIELRGGLASLDLLLVARRDGSAVRLDRLLAADWETFVGGRRSRLHYAASAFLIRFLARPEDPRRDDFMAFLDGVSRGGPPDTGGFETHLGPLPEVESAWVSYLLQQGLEAGLGSRLVVAPSSAG
ncbi:MAG: hypothetical protein R3190_12700, partial [Thermoanaerobaculia bacterium]|nr:hypothetical protein [Thermoanaerobaculia bacterium]